MSDIHVHCGRVKKLINKIVTISVYNDEHVKINITWLEVLKISCTVCLLLHPPAVATMLAVSASLEA